MRRVAALRPLTAAARARQSWLVPFLLDLLRHGAALPAADGGDAARPLSPGGQRDLERLSRHLAGLGWRPERAYTSPLIRARDSARIVLSHITPPVTPVTVDVLLPEADTSELLAWMSGDGAVAGHVLLVGHQPLLGDLVRRLTGGEAPGFAPGDLIRVEFNGPAEPGAGKTVWSVGPGDCA